MTREIFHLDESAWRNGRNAILGVLGLSGALLAGGYALDPKQAAFSYLTAFAFGVTICLGALFFVMVQHLTGSAWSVTSRRMAENLMANLPWMGLLFVPIAACLPLLYSWTRPDVVPGKAAYLNQPMFVLRSAIYFGLWSWWAYKLYRDSVSRDNGPVHSAPIAERWSAPGVLLLIVTGTLASFDWLMSLDPHWSSTIFGVYILSGGALAFLALWILILLGLRRGGLMRRAVNEEHYHDLGKWLFALTVFWAYIAFSQYLLIWYANLPEETAWFYLRIREGWKPVAGLILFGHFLAPFALLLSRGAKRNLKLLGAVAGWMLLMHYLELYWIIMPTLAGKNPQPHWLNAAALLAVLSAAALPFWQKLRSHALAPVGDVRFEEGLEFRNVL